MKRTLFTCTATVLLSLILLVASMPSHAALTDRLDKMVKKFTLPNGLTILIVERPVSPTVSFQISHRVGGADDPPGKTGLAHFLEHMLFKGTQTVGSRDYAKESEILDRMFSAGTALDAEKRKGTGADPETIRRYERNLEEAQRDAGAFAIKNEIHRLYTENGGVGTNAATGQDMTSYTVSLPANKIELWSRIEADRMSHPVFREFYSERNVVREERRQSVEANPERILMEAFLRAAFVVHPYGRPVIGLPEDIAFLDIDSLERFFRDRYAPNNTVIAVAGSVSAPALMSLIERYFGPIARHTAPLSAAIPEEPLQTAERHISVSLDANPQLIIGYHKPNLLHPDDAVFDVIEAILSSGRTARLDQALVERQQLVQRVNAVNGLPGNRYPNLFAILATPRKPHTVDETQKAIARELDRLKEAPVSQKELEKVKNRMRMDFLLSLKDNEDIAKIIAAGECLAGDFNFAERRLAQIEAVTPQDILRVCRQYLIETNRTVAILEPANQNNGGGP